MYTLARVGAVALLLGAAAAQSSVNSCRYAHGAPLGRPSARAPCRADQPSTRLCRPQTASATIPRVRTCAPSARTTPTAAPARICTRSTEPTASATPDTASRGRAIRVCAPPPTRGAAATAGDPRRRLRTAVRRHLLCALLAPRLPPFVPPCSLNPSLTKWRCLACFSLTFPCSLYPSLYLTFSSCFFTFRLLFTHQAPNTRRLRARRRGRGGG